MDREKKNRDFIKGGRGGSPFYFSRCKGAEEGEATSQLFGRISLTLMRANAMMLSTRQQDADFPLQEIDGVE